MDILKIITDLKCYITDESELVDIKIKTINPDIRELLLNCLSYSLNKSIVPNERKLLKIESIIDFLNDDLNTGHWSEVPILTRQYYTISSFVKCIIILKNNKDKECLRKCLKCLDLGLLLGAPLEKNPELLNASAKYISQLLHKNESFGIKNEVQTYFNKREINEPKDYSTLKGKIVDSINCPSLECFNKDYFIPQVPVIIKGCMEHWPALKKWPNVNYLLEVAGERTVPIEIGSQYVDDNWTQKLMTLKDFILKHYLSESEDIGYLAQHNLFEQIAELRGDIFIPEYCCLSLNYEESSEPDINAWLGPKGTVSPLHQDPKNNLLAQVFGTKQVILFSPQDTPYLYPHEDKLLNNTAQVNPLKPDINKYPDFVKSRLYKCLLEPGDLLFIPVKWWHHVTALEKSFSVSFWWQ